MTSCNVCNRRFDETDLLQSKQDEYFCTECFKQEYCSVSPKKKSPRQGNNNKCKGDAALKPNKMFTLAELAQIRQARESRTVYGSKRPLQCPHGDCNRYVSISDLSAHFQHEHIDVPVVQTPLDSRNPFDFRTEDVRYGVKQCLALLNFASPMADHFAALRETVTVAVLASRVAAAELGDQPNERCEESDGGANNDKIILWTASNVGCDNSYTVAVSTVSEDVRVKYYGPVLQLGDTPKKLCREGHCLILSHYHFLGMSENGSKPLHVDVIIHSED